MNIEIAGVSDKRSINLIGLAVEVERYQTEYIIDIEKLPKGTKFINIKYVPEKTARGY